MTKKRGSGSEEIQTSEMIDVVRCVSNIEHEWCQSVQIVYIARADVESKHRVGVMMQ